MGIYLAAALLLGAGALLAIFFYLSSENACLRAGLMKLRREDDRLYHYATGLARRMSRLRALPDVPDEASPRLQCAFFHDHPPLPVTAATWNPSNQPRPFHKPDRIEEH